MKYYLIIVFIIIVCLFYIYEKYYDKKIALCFLIYDKINHEELWYNWLKNVDKNKYNIYIHYKENKPLKYFEEYKVTNTIHTQWGRLSIVLAQNLLLKHALKDDKNQHFIWLSADCIPLKSFDYIYNFLDINKSYYNLSNETQIFPRANKLLKYINKKYIKKANMSSIINRKHAKLFIDNDTNIKKWFKCMNNKNDINKGALDEFVYITLLFKNNMETEINFTHELAADSIIFAQWPDMVNYKVFKNSNKINSYTYTYICPEELDYLIKSKSLFGRKFIDGCGGLETLNIISK